MKDFTQGLENYCPVCNRPLRYEGLCWECKADKERQEALELTMAEIAQRQAYLVEHIEELAKHKKPANKYFWDCLCYHGVIDKEVSRKAVRAEIYRPEAIYYHAPEDVRDILIERLMTTEDSEEANKLMGCLAMQGDDKALEALYELKKNPRKWRKELYVDSDVYAYAGGFSFDEAGKRIEINYDRCYSLEKADTNTMAVMKPRARGDKCPHCGSGLVDMITLDGRDERLQFIGVDGKITATCCPSCIIFTSTVYGSFDLEGNGEAVFPYNGLGEQEECYISEVDFQETSINALTFSEVERPLFYGAEDWEAATIGGFAHWMNDCYIPACPHCGKLMRYLAQIPYKKVTKAGPEGSIYIEICTDCRMVALQYQQT